MPASRVALIQGDNRKNNISRAMDQIAASVQLSGVQRVLIKPNFVSTCTPLAATHADAVRAVLEFVRERYHGPVTIAEGPSMEPAAEGFRNYGYEPLAYEFDADLFDLNLDDTLPVQVYDRRLRPLHLNLARTVVESDFRISVGPPKTHDVVVVTLSLKNMIMGSLISRFAHSPVTNKGRWPNLSRVKRALWRRVPLSVRSLPPVEWMQFRAMSNHQPSDKFKMHQNYPVMNLNLALVAPWVLPHLSVIDGFEAMEGNGPTGGTPVPLRAAIASTDALAADVVGAALMGFHVDDVGYLHYCKRMGLGAGRLDDIGLVGNATLEDCTLPFRPHDTIQRQLRWRSPRVEQVLP